MICLHLAFGQRTRSLRSLGSQGYRAALCSRRRLLHSSQHHLTQQTERTRGKRRQRRNGIGQTVDPNKESLVLRQDAQGTVDGGSTSIEAHEAETQDTNGAAWTSLRARLQASQDGEDETNAPVVGGKDHDAGPGKDATLTDVPSPKKAAGYKSKRKGKAEPEGKAGLEVQTIRPAKLKLHPIEEDSNRQAPQLCYNLDRVLFNPGVYHMQDQRSGVFNFDPYLASIMPVEEFDYNVLKEYVTSSKDSKLMELCAQHGKKYCGSTSSMTSILSHFHFLLSDWRRPNFESLSKSLDPESLNFTELSRGPAAAFARYKDGVYAIDADKEYDTDNILSMLGKSMEKFMTLPKQEFEKYRRSQSHQLSEEEKNAAEAYHFTTLGDFMMRSQLDAFDPRLPGSGVFDLKTRAVVSIRMDVGGYQKGVGYEIRKRFGKWESFEREYYDMIRAAFLKYSLQVRMGRMDGIFVAFHNTQRIFGFQYVSLAEMDHAIHGTNDTWLGDQEFKCSVALLNDLMNRATQRFPGRTLRLHVETRPTKVPLTYFFAEPVTDEEMRIIQEAGKPSAEELEREIRSLSREERTAEREAEKAQDVEATQTDRGDLEETDTIREESTVNEAQNENNWLEMMAKVDEAVENESLGIRSIREAVHEALEQSGLLQDKTELESERYLDDLVSALTAHSTESKENREAQGQEADLSEAQGDACLESGSDSATLAKLILRVTEGINDKNPNLRTFERKVADLAAQAKKIETIGADQPVVKNENEGGQVGHDVHEQAACQAEGDVKGTEESKQELFGMYVSVRNMVNGQFVQRPVDEGKRLDWNVQYTITELSDKRAQKIYASIKRRRKEVLAKDPRERSEDWYRMFKGQLPIITKQGEKFREKRRQLEQGSPVYVAWDRAPLPSDSSSPGADE